MGGFQGFPARASRIAVKTSIPLRVALRRRLRAVAAEPHLPQETIRDRHDGQVLYDEMCRWPGAQQ
jgi:hypothetical protein